MPKKPFATSYGTTVQAAVNPAAALPSDPVQRELVLAIRNVGGVEALKRLRAGDTGPAPEPTTTQDVAHLASAATTMAKDFGSLAKTQTDSAREEAEAERKRRRETEDNMGAAVESAREEQAGQFSQILQLVSDHDTQMFDMLREDKAAAVAVEQSRAAQIAAEMKASNDVTVAELKAQIQHRDEKISELSGEIATLRSKKSWQEELAESLVSGNLDEHPFVKLHQRMSPPPPPVPVTPTPEDPEITFRRHLATQLPAEVVAARRDQRENENLIATEKARLYQDLRGGIGTIVGLLRNFLGGPRYDGFPATAADAEAYERANA